MSNHKQPPFDGSAPQTTVRFPISIQPTPPDPPRPAQHPYPNPYISAPSFVSGSLPYITPSPYPQTYPSPYSSHPFPQHQHQHQPQSSLPSHLISNFFFPISTTSIRPSFLLLSISPCSNLSFPPPPFPT
ncbi:hypothetical protein GEMRC1_005767 [Eukaryota sp. GEM-RC1]